MTKPSIGALRPPGGHDYYDPAPNPTTPPGGREADTPRQQLVAELLTALERVRALEEGGHIFLGALASGDVRTAIARCRAYLDGGRPAPQDPSA